MLIINFFKFLYWYFRDLYFFLKDKEGRKEFNGYGVIMYVGLPGYGKTISVVEYLNRMRLRYPGLKIYTNFCYKYEDKPIRTWKDLIAYEGPAIFVIDEVQLTFNSREWSNFPKEMVTMLTQNRKMRKQIITTSQSFERVDKVFRELCNYVVECRCIGGRWVFQKWFEVQDYILGGANDQVRHRHRSKRYNFVQTDKIRDSFDTLKRLDDLQKVDFVSDENRKLQQIKDMIGG